MSRRQKSGRTELCRPGAGTLSLKDDSSVRSLNVSDVGKVEEFLQEKNVNYTMTDVPRVHHHGSSPSATGYLYTGRSVPDLMLMNRQGGGANSKAMNFGKSRAKLSTE